MFEALCAGVLFGLSAGWSPGPLMALVIRQTVQHGGREGVKAGLAPLITDIPIVLVTMLFLSRLGPENPVLGILSGAGGVYVLYMAYETARAQPPASNGDSCLPRSLLRATLVNALSPHPYLFWVVVGGPFMKGLMPGGWLPPTLFVVSFYVALVGSKATLAILLGRGRGFFTGRVYRVLMVLLAGALAIFAVLLMRDAGVRLWGLANPLIHQAG